MEKVLYINLPDGADYRGVELAEDGRIGIVYTDKVLLTTAIPMPMPLIGGTKVYQKDNGTPYWYCKIKEGKDEFMCLYFDDLTETDLLYDENGKQREFTTDREKNLKADILKALNNKPIKGFTWLPVYEPSLYCKGNVQYVSGENVLTGLTCHQWEKLFNYYSPINGSHMASITTYFLLLLRWLKDGLATIEQLAVNSKEIGHYYDSENAKHRFEKTGERQFGGLKGFVGNTYKIVKDSESFSRFSAVGGSFNSYGNNSMLDIYHYPLGDVTRLLNRPCNKTRKEGVGLLELEK